MTQFAYRAARAQLPSQFGDFRIEVIEAQDEQLVVLTCGTPGEENVLVRLHSECLTGDVFGSLRCDCRDQLLASMQAIKEAGHGYVFYLRQEGRGIGLYHKILAYALQEEGLDTVQANQQLGLPVDARSYELATRVLKNFGVRSIRLLTNNPDKIAACEAAGLAVTERISIEGVENPFNRSYLTTKRDLLGHTLRNVTGKDDLVTVENE
ncbi:GTP cyclohydrolase II [Deinococcus sp. QL22]|uniref:GTP cyclohydrolase II n=1 Tax=Deinococcus sp. QL22 TaxID=2939437 RepID=UPI0020181D2A|nr:GTP cyclohydrolase II [Deinococcus sp. QL22]UQN07960.1 GTP cyclohydrolase II [Deinococcus sp. QL22]